MTTQIIGWPTTAVACSIKQGGSGTVRFAFVVTKANGDPLDSYDGWTAALALCRQPQSDPEISMTPAVVGDALGMRLIVDVEFNTDETDGTPPGTLTGDMCLIDPDGEGHYPANLTLTVQRSYAVAPPAAP